MGPSTHMSPRKSRAELAYHFFLQAERTQRSFTPEELAEATGYTINTAKIYLNKKWWWFALLFLRKRSWWIIPV